MSRIYSEWVDWYRLIDPPADHAEEAASFLAAFERGIAGGTLASFLELGAGAGHNALHLKSRFAESTLTDLSPEMSALSRELNPEAIHVVSDMRATRLDRTFDAVLVHDAIQYMLTEADLAAAITTAFVHTRPGGVALFVPDDFADSFAESTEILEHDEGGRSLRAVMWAWDPDPNDTTTVTEYGFLLRDASGVKQLHDRHVEGLFPIATWRRLLAGAGFEVESFGRPLGDGAFDEAFLCRRPGR